MEECGTFQNPLPLEFRNDGQQNLQIIGTTKVRVMAVSSLDDTQLFGNDGNRIRKRKCAAIEGAVREWLPGFQWKRS